MTPQPAFYIRRTNAIGNVFYLRPNGEWIIEWQGGVGGYKLHTWKTERSARWRAVQLSMSFKDESISVVTDTPTPRVVETYVGGNAFEQVWNTDSKSV